jgi:hypothetical protein
MPTYDLKFLVDVGVGKKVEDFLYKSGYAVLPVRKINPRMSDSEIIGIEFLYFFFFNIMIN